MPVDCGDLDTPTNGAARIYSTLFGNRAIFRCNTGFVCSGCDAPRICLATGEWSGSEVTCPGLYVLEPRPGGGGMGMF